MVEQAGFEIEQELHPDCDGQSSAPACVLITKSDAGHVRVTVYPPGRDVGLEEVQGGRRIVLVTEEK
jgi:hypothetical protein